jgi:hypothetical protein
LSDLKGCDLHVNRHQTDATKNILRRRCNYRQDRI